jgi:hypothetical protein
LEIDEEEGGGDEDDGEERERREKEKLEAEQLEAERKAKLEEDRKNEERCDNLHPVSRSTTYLAFLTRVCGGACAVRRQREEREKRRCLALGKAGEEWMGRSFPSLADGNLIYHLWTFGDLRLLIRCKLHGYTKTPAVPHTPHHRVVLRRALIVCRVCRVVSCRVCRVVSCRVRRVKSL